MSISSTRMVTLKSCDGEIFVVEESAAVLSRTIKNMIENDRADQIIPIHNVSGKILSKVIEFCRRKHSESAAASLVDQKEIKPWEYEFVRVDKSTLQGLDKAAVVLGINNLMDLTFQTLAKGIATQEIRKKIRIEKYCTKEGSEEELRKTYRIPNDPSKEIDSPNNFGKESTQEEESESLKQYSIQQWLEPLKERDFLKNLGKESPEYTKEEGIELRKQCIIRNGVTRPPTREIDFLKNLGKVSPEYTKAEASELWKQYNIRHDPHKEIDVLKNFGKESTKAEEKTRVKIKIID